MSQGIMEQLLEQLVLLNQNLAKPPAAPAPEPAPETPEPKRARKPKAEPPTVTTNTAAVEVTPVAPAAPVPEAKPVAMTTDQLRAEFIRYAGEPGNDPAAHTSRMQQIADLLTAVIGEPKLSKAKPEQYPAIIAALEKLQRGE